MAKVSRRMLLAGAGTAAAGLAVGAPATKRCLTGTSRRWRRASRRRRGSSKSGRLPWLTSTINAPDILVAQGFTSPPRWKNKVVLLREQFTDRQVSTAYSYLTRPETVNPVCGIGFTTFGGQINALSPTDTATPHRDSVAIGSVSAA